MLSPAKSFYNRTLCLLMPFVIGLVLLYSVGLAVTIFAAEDAILGEYLEQEYVVFQHAYDREGPTAPLPSSSFLQGYWQGDSTLPSDFSTLTAGLHERDDDSHVLVVERQGQPRLYLTLIESGLSPVSRYQRLFETLIIVIGGLAIVAGLCLATVIAHRLTKPISELSGEVSEGWRPDQIFSSADREDEIGSLSRAFRDLLSQLHGALQREQSFTRHASHEMRTPVAVIKNAVAVLQLPDCAEAKRRRNLQRIDSAAINLEELIQLFLWLGRERQSVGGQLLSVQELLQQQLSKLQHSIDARNIAVHSVVVDQSLHSEPGLVAAIIHNLINNAILHGSGDIEITLGDGQFCVCNPVAVEGGKSGVDNCGYGLEIVGRICAHAGWQFEQRRERSRFYARWIFNPQ